MTETAEIGHLRKIFSVKPIFLLFLQRFNFKELEREKTRVTLIESGWGEGEEWDKAFAYFSSAWPDIVLARLKYRFEAGPLDWSNLPEFFSGAGK